MRWPLRNQFLLPMIGLMLATLIGVSLLNAFLSVRRTRLRIEHELAQVTETLAESNFPLTDSVLEQMRGLTGAEFVLTTPRGNVIASSTKHDAFLDLPSNRKFRDNATPALATPITISQRRFFHTGIVLRRQSETMRSTTLHILYPEENYLQAWRDVAYPPLLVGGTAIVLVIVLSLGVALRVTRPLRRLQVQVDEIAEGNFRLVPVPDRNDEIADLSRSVNRMAGMLAHYEVEVRRNEQLRTLGQLGGGIAHQIRNSVTGCRMAVDLHARECPLEGDGESLDVAKRQLELMEKHLQRFLSLGRTETKPHTRVSLKSVVGNVVSLVRPTARHVGVELEWNLPDESVEICGDVDSLEQLLVNLVINGIEAASHLRGDELADCHPEAARRTRRGREDASLTTSVPKVIVSLRRVDDYVELEVEDTGKGPAADVEAKLFEPFITEKPDGTGLGLSVAQEIASDHGGKIRWHRRDAKTFFTVDFPTATDREEINSGD